MWERLAEQGLDSAQYNLGLAYYNGYGVKKNKKKAVELWERSTEQGNADFQNVLGRCYEKGIGVKKDPSKAVELYQKAADQGNARAQKNLGRCYKNGIGVEQNPLKAKIIFESQKRSISPLSRLLWILVYITACIITLNNTEHLIVVTIIAGFIFAASKDKTKPIILSEDTSYL